MEGIRSSIGVSFSILCCLIVGGWFASTHQVQQAWRILDQSADGDWNHHSSSSSGSANAVLVHDASLWPPTLGTDPEEYQKEILKNRTNRFPSVEQRVRLYMGAWFDCAGYERIEHRWDSSYTNLWVKELGVAKDDKDSRSFRIDSEFNGSKVDGVFDRVHVLNRKKMERSCTHRYCLDVMEFLFPALDEHSNNSSNSTFPILFQFGDAERTVATLASPIGSNGRKLAAGYPRLPVLKKFRRAGDGLISRPCGSSGLDQPIVFKLKTQRHFGPVLKVDGSDLPWKEKINKAIFRGALTGLTNLSQRPKEFQNMSSVEKCRMIPRCKLVHYLASKKSALVDAMLIGPKINVFNDSNVELYGKEMSMNELLQYKAIIMMEGNDVSSGLKWALYSNSVVMMPMPRFTSWAMEELLEPWVHYIPISLNLTDNARLLDVERKVQWLNANQEKAKQIALNGRLWISDLLFHRDSKRDEKVIIQEMVRRYRQVWAGVYENSTE